MRAADADARGNITNMAVTMKTANRICIAYCSEANIAPTCMTPASMRWLPTQIIARLVMLSIRMSAGISTAIRRLTRDRGVGQIEVRAIEPFALAGAAIERANDADTAQPLAEHEREPIDLALHGRGQRHGATHDEREHSRHHRHDGDQHPRQLRVLRQRQNHAADGHHRRRDHHGEHHDDHLLHLGGVVGRAGDQRGRAEPSNWWTERRSARAKIAPRRFRPKPVATFAENSCRRSRTAVATIDISSIRPPISRMARVSPRTMPRSTISDVNRGSQQVAERLREGQHEHQGDLAAMGSQKAREFQHRRCVGPPSGGRRRTVADSNRGYLVWQIVSLANEPWYTRRRCPAPARQLEVAAWTPAPRRTNSSS